MSDSVTQLNAALGGRYRVERELGEGGMARVYLAHDLKHERRVALKVLKPELARAVGAERFLQEIRVTARLQHPHILPLFDSGEAQGFLYYVMPFVEGESLQERLSREGQLDLADAVRIFREIVDALGAAHARGIVHRDVKPGNVLLTGRHALVADFGVAKALSEAASTDRLTTIGVALGTPAYMAPEQAAADPGTDHRADLFAAGVIAYEMLTGTSPFAAGSTQATMAALLTRTPEPISELRAGVPAELCQAVDRCLEKDPAGRWQGAAELLLRLEGLETPSAGVTPLEGSSRHSGRWRNLGLSGVGVAVVATVLFGLFGQDREAWARNEAMPEIERLADVGAWEAAHRLAAQVEDAVPGDPRLEELRDVVARSLTVESRPAGATVRRRQYGSDGEWEELGTTPLRGVLIPRGPTAFRLELEGHRTVDILSTGGMLTVPMDPVETLADDMVRVPGFDLLDAEAEIRLRDFFMDRYEVTNRQYKGFVDAGGYEQPRFWEHPFVENGRVLSWDQAMARFTDRTGLPGPSTWEVGSFPDGLEDHPVGGVSWYEAAAYAQFAGKSLPTIHHWRRAFPPNQQAYVIPLSNLEGSGTAPVGAHRGMSRFGASDMAGNVREWCFNESDGQRFIMGGGWNDPLYVATGPYAQPAFDRSETNGIRLVSYLPETEGLELARQPVPPEPIPDFDRFEPVSDEVFAVYRRMFEYDHTPLRDSVTAVDTAHHWVRERITFDAAYGRERMVVYLYLPREFRPPFQTVVYFPGSGALNTRSFDEISSPRFDFIVKSGRAVAYPIYKGTFERGTELASQAQELSLPFASTPRPTNLYRDHVVMWVKDLGRTIDYLEGRPDLDTASLAYFGISWGGRMGAIMLAVEPRFEAGILHIAGFNSSVPHPEVHAVNYASRVTTPVLMLNGRYDHVFPLETNATPMFTRLGTPPEHKRQVVSDGGHFVPRTELIRESLAWLDRYLGSTR